LLGRSADALKDCDRALKIETGKYQDGLRAVRAHTLALLGETASALTEADRASKSKELDGVDLAELAAAYALLAASVAKDDKLPATERTERVERHASRAIELLRQAKAKGHRSIVPLDRDADFASLRSRSDFQALVREGKP
jgi:hypothetical protein